MRLTFSNVKHCTGTVTLQPDKDCVQNWKVSKKLYLNIFQLDFESLDITFKAHNPSVSSFVYILLKFLHIRRCSNRMVPCESEYQANFLKRVRCLANK